MTNKPEGLSKPQKHKLTTNRCCFFSCLMGGFPLLFCKNVSGFHDFSTQEVVKLINKMCFLTPLRGLNEMKRSSIFSFTPACNVAKNPWLLAVFPEELKCRLGDQHVLKARNWDCNRHKLLQHGTLGSKIKQTRRWELNHPLPFRTFRFCNGI